MTGILAELATGCNESGLLGTAPLLARRPKAQRRKAAGQDARSGFVAPGEEEKGLGELNDDQELHCPSPTACARGCNA